jgi:CelD/BcsL family acetyltransferase involved in cellulose biosynthesis
LVRVGGFEEVFGDWEAILPHCSTNTVFVTPWWQETWWRHFGDDAELRLLVLRDDSSVLGIAPMMLSDGVLRFLGGTDLFDYHDFLVPAGNEAVFYDALFDYLPEMEWHTIELTSLPQDSFALGHVTSRAKSNGYAVEVQREDVAPVLRLPPTWDEYLAGLSKKRRHELRRKLRRLEGAGVISHTVCDDPSALPECMQDFFRLHRASKQEKAEFMTAERERFFVDAAVELASRGQFRLTFLAVDDIRVASCMGFDYGDSYLLYNSGYDPSYSELSVGLLSKALSIRDAIGARKQSFDFLRGTERYKYDLGAEDIPIYRVTVRR